MKKLHSLALCALVTPVLTFGAGSVLAQQSSDRDTDRSNSNMQHEQSSQRDRDSTRSGAVSTQGAQGKQHHERSDSKTMADRQGKSGKQNTGFMDSAPDKGMHASKIMDATVKTTDGKDVGSVSDLIVDKDGQIVAIVVGVGGILGMGEKDVAIGWDDVKKSGDSDDLELQIDKSRDELRSAKEFKSRD